MNRFYFGLVFISILALASCKKVLDIGDIVGYNYNINIKTYSSTDIDIDEFPGDELKVQVDYEQINEHAFEQKISIAPIRNNVEIAQFTVAFQKCTDTILIDTITTYRISGCAADLVDGSKNDTLQLPSMVLSPELPATDTFLSKQVRFQYHYFDQDPLVYEGVVNTNIFYGPSFTDAYIVVRIIDAQVRTYAVHFLIDDNNLNFYESVLISKI